ncbi:hypothetical protein LOTGIDRAFT_145967 [Lottia gigantea]|uniref:glycine--tRNA ligase n=1 Tax=Lottia gigantea TaxID=225164 RepID=V3ZTR9_LOTGI|nr:hypothetical protein LOTGIDRAFT_145967 [Lottia gigantea]ESO87782.1 hypothetical protein LOTGIDRAFT_145967 [Lottia gigantea]
MLCLCFVLSESYLFVGVSGLYDFGPMGCAMKSNLIQLWRKFFILEEQMLEVEAAMLTPSKVLKASGHVDRFQDYMVEDLKNGECFRADHLIEAHLEKLIADKKTPEDVKEEAKKMMPMIDGMSQNDMKEAIIKYDIKSPVKGNDISEPKEFNLMFSTSIGPTGQHKGFLRPETAQGIFVNFKRLLAFNAGKLPFAGAQIGNAFRNEISPRSGLLRVREFTMAEIEHFCDPNDKSHPKFAGVSDLKLSLYSACNQMDGKPMQSMTIAEAVSSKLVANETLGYFMARIYLFLLKVGINPSKFRFRQHLSNEMAHYACDCWDAELKTSYGWIECVGCADRSCYDLTQHTEATGVKLVADRKLPEPISFYKQIVSGVVRTCTSCVHLFYCLLYRSSRTEHCILSILTSNDILHCMTYRHLYPGDHYLRTIFNIFVISIIAESLTLNDISHRIDDSGGSIGKRYARTDMIAIPYGVTIDFDTLQAKPPTVTLRERDTMKQFISLPASIAPYKCSVLPITNNVEFNDYIKQLSESLTLNDISHRIDDSGGSIGKRYARTDMIAIPYGVTIDFDTLQAKPPTVTLRERDTMKQVRAKMEEIPQIVKDLVDGRRSWDDILKQYPIFEGQESTK